MTIGGRRADLVIDDWVALTFPLTHGSYSTSLIGRICHRCDFRRIS